MGLRFAKMSAKDALKALNDIRLRMEEREKKFDFRPVTVYSNALQNLQVNFDLCFERVFSLIECFELFYLIESVCILNADLFKSFARCRDHLLGCLGYEISCFDYFIYLHFILTGSCPVGLPYDARRTELLLEDEFLFYIAKDIRITNKFSNPCNFGGRQNFEFCFASGVEGHKCCNTSRIKGLLKLKKMQRFIDLFCRAVPRVRIITLPWVNNGACSAGASFEVPMVENPTYELMVDDSVSFRVDENSALLSVPSLDAPSIPIINVREVSADVYEVPVDNSTAPGAIIGPASVSYVNHDEAARMLSNPDQPLPERGHRSLCETRGNTYPKSRSAKSRIDRFRRGGSRSLRKAIVQTIALSNIAEEEDD